MSGGIITDFYFADAPLQVLSDRHSHNTHQILFVLEGSICCEIAGSAVTCTAPGILFIGNYEPHVITAASDRYVRYVLTLDPYKADAQIRPAMLSSVLSFHPAGFVHAMDVTAAAGEVRELTETLYREWIRPQNEKLPEGESLLLCALLYRLWQISPGHFTEKSFGAAEKITASVRRDLECAPSARLDLSALAARHHISRHYLSHVFRSVTGYSLKEYQMLCRISLSCRQLTETEMQVGRIAEEAGFHDMSNFSRAFKAVIGMTPSQFRKRNRHGGTPAPFPEK